MDSACVPNDIPPPSQLIWHVPAKEIRVPSAPQKSPSKRRRAGLVTLKWHGLPHLLSTVPVVGAAVPPVPLSCEPHGLFKEVASDP